MRPPAVLDGIGIISRQLHLNVTYPLDLTHTINRRPTGPWRFPNTWRWHGRPPSRGCGNGQAKRQRTPQERTDDLEIRHANHLVEDIGIARGDPSSIQATDLEGEDTLQFPINNDLPTWARFQTNDVLTTLARAPINADLTAQEIMEGDPELGGSHLKQFQTVIRGFLETIIAPVTILDSTPTADMKRHRAIRNLPHRNQSHSPRIPRGPGKMGKVTDGDLRRVTIHQTRAAKGIISLLSPGDVRRIPGPRTPRVPGSHRAGAE